MSKNAIHQARKSLFELIRKEAFFRKKVILSSGKESDYYLDLRLISLKSEGIYYIAQCFSKLLEGIAFDAIGGPTLGADPIISGLAYHCYLQGSPISTFIIRKTPKKHGTQRLIEGPVIPAASRVVVIDDVATTGKSFLESFDVLQGEGITVVLALAVVDRQEGATELLRERGVPLKSIFTASDFLRE